MNNGKAGSDNGGLKNTLAQQRIPASRMPQREIIIMITSAPAHFPLLRGVNTLQLEPARREPGLAFISQDNGNVMTRI